MLCHHNFASDLKISKFNLIKITTDFLLAILIGSELQLLLLFSIWVA